MLILILIKGGGRKIGRLTPKQRHLAVKAVRKGLNKSFVARAFGITRKTLYKWWNRAKKATNYLYRDKPRVRKKKKVTVKAELSILELRHTFKWGTARIQQGLMKLPSFMKKVLNNIVQRFQLSRQTINNVLKQHKLNGYRREQKAWKFFRAKKPNELWQLDIKGPFRVQGKRYWFLICVDDYSRFILLAEQYEHDLKLKEIEQRILPLIKKHKPKKILTDNKPFGESWEKWCKEQGTKAIFAHPYYPQDKGKVERTIRNANEEFIKLLVKFPQWLDGCLKHFRNWYNKDRFHRGINAKPAQLFVI